MTITSESGITVLKPSEGMRLTDGETVAEGEVYVGKNDAPENWREVTEAEAEEVRKRVEEAARAEEEGTES